MEIGRLPALKGSSLLREHKEGHLKPSSVFRESDTLSRIAAIWVPRFIMAVFSADVGA